TVELGIANSDGAEQEIAVAADVLGERLHADIDTVREGLEEDSGGPVVVEDDERTATMRGFGDGGDVLDLHADGAGTLAPDQSRVVAKELGDARADGGRVERE